MAKLEHKLFSRHEFQDLLQREAERCRRIAEGQCLGDLPLPLLFHAPRLDVRVDPKDPGLLRVPAATVLGFDALLPLLWRPDGFFRRWVDLGPEAVTEEATVLEVYWADDWTDAIFVGADAFPGEPFKLSGPALPHDWTEGSPAPRVRLPRLRIVSSDYPWPLL